MGKIYSNLLKSIVLPVADKAMKTSIASTYHLIKKLKGLSKDEIQHWQNSHLKHLIMHAYVHTNYYKKIFDDARLKPDDIKASDDLSRLPVLTKKIIKDNFQDILPDNLEDIPYKKTATGGSTGDPMIYYHDYRSWSMSNTNQIINWEKVGYNYGDKYVALGSSSLFVNKQISIKNQIYYRLKNKIALNGINMSDDVCQGYVTLIKKNNIRYIYGYASAIYLFAKYALQHDVRLNIHACFPTSEILTEQFQKTIHDAFNCEILNCYGANDGGITAYAHNKGFFEVGYNCIIRLDSQDQEGFGSALLTDLFNYAMPLINYKLGDVVLIDAAKNKTYSYNGQIINQILGRTSDIIHLGNGRTLTGPGFTVLFKDIPVDYYCIEKTALCAITCWIIKLPTYNDEHERKILETIKKQAGEDINISFKYTNTPFLNESGKRKYFINNR